jgi:2-polyprenyl-6-methoxyphenol hydroxylase-like FAD-dependent oxidoreductase
VTAAGGELLDVLVVGAGPTGLTLAAQLRGLGATVRIVDRQLDRVQESRALGVQPRTLEVLRGLGLAEALIGRGNDAVWAQLHAGGRVVRIRLFGLGLDDTAYPFLLLVSQAETKQVRARYVVGCDGASSTVRRAAKIAFPGGAYPQTFALADLEAEPLDRGAAHAFLAEEGIVLFFPLGRPASWRMLAMHPGLQGRREPAQPSLEELQALADAMTGRDDST